MKNYMSAITQGVYVIGSRKGEKTNLMTAAWVTQVSAKPNQILVAVGATHYTAEILRENPDFVLSVLAEGQEEAAKYCGFHSGRNTDKAKGVDCEYDEQELPMVKGAAAYLFCKVQNVVEMNDHVLFIADVVAGSSEGKPVLKYVEEEYFG